MKIYVILSCLFISVFFSDISAQTWVYPSNRAQAETPIAVNPTNPDNIIGSAITIILPGDSILPSDSRIGYYYTLNGGVDWHGSDDISGPGAGDPVIQRAVYLPDTGR